MALSPQERTWNELQANLQRKRQAHSHQQEQQSRHYNRYRKKASPSPLPRISDSPSIAPLRGSHYPVIPPVAHDRYDSDDAMSLQSYSSELAQIEDNSSNNGHLHSQPQSPLHILYNEAVRGRGQGHGGQPQQANRHDPWNSSTRFIGDKRPIMQSRTSSEGHPVRPPPDAPRRGRRGAGRGRDLQPRRKHRGKQAWKESYEQDESATVVQRHYRGFKTRKNLKLMHHLQDPSFASSFMHHFLRDVLQNDLILDVACEVLVEERTKKQKMRGRMLTPAVKSTSVTTPLNRSFWAEALDRSDIHKPVASSLLLEVMHEETLTITSESINELLNEYFETKVMADTTNIMLSELLVDMMPSLFDECRKEVVEEMIVDDLIDAETQAYVSGFLEETMLRGVMPLDPDEEQVQINEVSQVAEGFLLEMTLLDHLLSTVVHNNQIWNQMEEADRFLDNRLSEILLNQYAGIVHNMKATEECVPLKRLHEMVLTDVAVDTILDELSAQLEEDLFELDDNECG